jgi:hypothetical protein
MLPRLDSQLGKFTARLRRLVAKPRDFELLLAGLSTKSSELRVGGPVFGHRLRYETPTARAREQRPRRTDTAARQTLVDPTQDIAPHVWGVPLLVNSTDES